MTTECTNCYSQKITSYGERSTDVLYKPHRDIFFRVHNHNNNTRSEFYSCFHCGHKWYVYHPHTCWCGWIQDINESNKKSEPKRFCFCF
jgi:hypothetical protein